MNDIFPELNRVCKGVDAPAKLLWMRWLRQIGHGALPMSAQSLAREEGVSKRTAARSLDQLVKAGFLICTSASAVGAGRGRSASVYQAAPGYEQLGTVAKWKVPPREDGGRPDSRHFKLIRQLLLAHRGEGRQPTKEGAPPSRRGAGQRLSGRNRMTMMVLLAHGDASGVVRDREPSVLARIAGLTTTQFHGQVEKLVRLGYIRAVVPGVTGKTLFGVRPGIFFLNLSHPAYGQVAIRGLTLVLQPESIEYPSRFAGDAQRLYGKAREYALNGTRLSPLVTTEFEKELIGIAGIGEPSVIQSVASYLDQIGSQGLPAYLQARIEDYASWLLSNRWMKLLGNTEDEEWRRDTVRWLDNRMQIELFPVPLNKSRKGDAVHAAAPDRSGLTALVIQYSVNLAKQIQWAMKSVSLRPFFGGEADFSTMRNVIVPAIQGSNKSSFVVVSIPKENSGEFHEAWLVIIGSDATSNFRIMGNRYLERHYDFHELRGFGIISGDVYPVT